MKRAGKLSRRPRVVESEECPTCGRKAGEGCLNYRRKGCAPHAVEVVAEGGVTEGGPTMEFQQGDLFAGSVAPKSRKGAGHG